MAWRAEMAIDHALCLHLIDIDALVRERGRGSRVRVPGMAVSQQAEGIRSSGCTWAELIAHGAMTALHPGTGACVKASPERGFLVASSHCDSCSSRRASVPTTLSAGRARDETDEAY